MPATGVPNQLPATCYVCKAVFAFVSSALCVFFCPILQFHSCTYGLFDLLSVPVLCFLSFFLLRAVCFMGVGLGLGRGVLCKLVTAVFD